MRGTALILFSIAVSSGSVAVAQNQPAARNSTEASPAQEASDEVIVRGKRLGELRLRAQVAREHAFDIFNEINSDDDFDVHCRNETRTFSHATRRVCRAQFENRIAAAAGKDYLDGLIMGCLGPGGVTQACMFSGLGERGVVRAQKAENPSLSKHQQMDQEIVRLANEDPRFAQAILDYYQAHQELEAAGKRRDD